MYYWIIAYKKLFLNQWFSNNSHENEIHPIYQVKYLHSRLDRANFTLRREEDGESTTHSLMLVTSLSSIMLQVCSVIIISPMIRGSRLTAHVVIVNKATSALASSGIVHRHLEWKLTAKKRRFVRTTATLRGERRFSRDGNSPAKRDSDKRDRSIHDRDRVRRQLIDSVQRDPAWLFSFTTGGMREASDRSVISFPFSSGRIGSWRKRLHGDAYVLFFL